MRFFFKNRKVMGSATLCVLFLSCQSYSEIAQKYLSEEKRKSLSLKESPEESPSLKTETVAEEEAEAEVKTEAETEESLVTTSFQGGAEEAQLPQIEESLKELRGLVEVLVKNQEDQQAEWKRVFEDLTQKINELQKNNSSATDKENTLFQQGEDFFQKKQYKSAIIYYEKYREKINKSHPLYKKVLFQIGFCFQQLKMNREAAVFLKEVVQDFPKSVEAGRAQLLLSDKK